MPDIPTFAPRLRRAVGSAVDTATSIVLDQRKRLYDAEVQHQYSRGVYEMDTKFNEFMVDAANRQDYMNLDKDWDQFQKETYSDITSRFTLPEAQQAFEKSYLNDEPRRRFYVAQQARGKQIKATVADAERSVDFAVQMGDREKAALYIDAYEKTGIPSREDALALREETEHRITIQDYRKQADVMMLMNPTEANIAEVEKWWIDNTPGLGDKERQGLVNEWSWEWKTRLQGMEADAGETDDAADKAMQAHWSNVGDNAQALDNYLMAKAHPDLQDQRSFGISMKPETFRTWKAVIRALASGDGTEKSNGEYLKQIALDSYNIEIPISKVIADMRKGLEDGRLTVKDFEHWTDTATTEKMRESAGVKGANALIMGTLGNLADKTDDQAKKQRMLSILGQLQADLRSTFKAGTYSDKRGADGGPSELEKYISQQMRDYLPDRSTWDPRTWPVVGNPLKPDLGIPVPVEPATATETQSRYEKRYGKAAQMQTDGGKVFFKGSDGIVRGTVDGGLTFSRFVNGKWVPEK